MKIRKKLLSILMAAALVLSLLPGLSLPAAAAYDREYNIQSGSIEITTAGNYRIYGTGTATSNNINIQKNILNGDVNITLENVNISSSTFAFLIQIRDTVNLTLVGTNIIKGGDNWAGVQVRNGGSLTITKESTGSLSATGGTNGAGIGGCSLEWNPSRGMITIEGGTVTAQGGLYGPGIGTGIYYTTNSSSGVVIITGGTVTATGGNYGAGIGTGGYDGSGSDYDGDSGMVYITGGTVTATGGSYGGAGIGGGRTASCGAVFITGGTVTATGTFGAAGIGSGIGGMGYQGAGLVNISGGNVTATGGSISSISVGGAGIGGGAYTDADTVIISGGVITATGGIYGGAGIGGGSNDALGGGDGGTVTITGGTVTAVGGASSADIGGGKSAASNGSLYVSSASVNADFADAVYQDNTDAVQVYKTTVTGLPVSSVVTCAVGDGDSFEMMTDVSGYLYLWLPESTETTLDIRKGSAEYTAAGAVSSAVANSFAATAVGHTASGGGAYSLAAVASTAYTAGAASGNLPTMTVKTGESGFAYFEVSIFALTGHTGTETAVFVLTRGGQQIAINATTADFDTVDTAKAGFNVKAGDVVTVYIVDSLTNGSGTSPTVL